MYMYEVFCRAAAPMTRAEGFGNNKIEAEIEIFLKKTQIPGTQNICKLGV